MTDKDAAVETSEEFGIPRHLGVDMGEPGKRNLTVTHHDRPGALSALTEGLDEIYPFSTNDLRRKIRDIRRFAAGTPGGTWSMPVGEALELSMQALAYAEIVEARE